METLDEADHPGVLKAFRVTARHPDDAWMDEALKSVKADLNRLGESAVGRVAIREGSTISVVHDDRCGRCGRQEGIEVEMVEKDAPYGHVWTYIQGTIVPVVMLGGFVICTICLEGPPWT